MASVVEVMYGSNSIVITMLNILGSEASSTEVKHGEKKHWQETTRSMNSDLTWDLIVASTHVQIDKCQSLHGSGGTHGFLMCLHLINEGHCIQLHLWVWYHSVFLEQSMRSLIIGRILKLKWYTFFTSHISFEVSNSKIVFFLDY